MPNVDDPDRMLAALKSMRAECVRAQAGVVIGGEVYQALERLRCAIDDLVGAVTGNREALWPKPHKAN
jgi:hypothetical protein